MAFIKKRSTNETFIESVTVNPNDVKVTEKTIYNISSVSSSIELISNIVSMLDVGLYKQVRCDKMEEIEQDTRLYKLNIEPNLLMNSTNLKKKVTEDMIIHGVSYVNYERENLYYVENKKVAVKLDTEDITKDAKITIGAKDYEVWDFVIPTLNSINGVQGEGLLVRNKDLLALALAEQQYLNKTFVEGGLKKGYFTSDKKLNDDAFTEFKSAVKDMISNKEPNMIFNQGMQYNSIAGSNTELQVVEAKTQLEKEIRSLFNIPENLSDDTFRIFMKTKIQPILNAIESALNKTLLTTKEKNEGYKFLFKMHELTRADIKERYQAYAVALKNGFVTINEIRAKENFESIEGLDIVKMSLGEVIYNIDTGEYFTPNMDARNSLTGPKKEDIYDENIEKDI